MRFNSWIHSIIVHDKWVKAINTIPNYSFVILFNKILRLKDFRNIWEIQYWVY